MVIPITCDLPRIHNMLRASLCLCANSLTPSLVPRYTAPRIAAFNQKVSPRVLDGVGGHISAAATGKWSGRGSKSVNAVLDMHRNQRSRGARVAASGAPQSIGTAPCSIAREDADAKKAQTTKKIMPNRPADCFTGKWLPASIDCSSEAINRIAQVDNDKRSLQELRYVFVSFELGFDTLYEMHA